MRRPTLRYDIAVIKWCAVFSVFLLCFWTFIFLAT